MILIKTNKNPEFKCDRHPFKINKLCKGISKIKLYFFKTLKWMFEGKGRIFKKIETHQRSST